MQADFILLEPRRHREIGIKLFKGTALAHGYEAQQKLRVCEADASSSALTPRISEGQEPSDLFALTHGNSQEAMTWGSSRIIYLLKGHSPRWLPGRALVPSRQPSVPASGAESQRG